MAKYMEPFESTTDLFNQAILVADLERHLNITVIADNKAKDLFKVTKANPILEYRTGDNVIIYLNEGIFDKLTEPQRLIVIDEALSYIVYDVEHDKLTIKKPDVITFSEILTKHTFETWNVLRESVKTLYAAEKQEGDQEDDEVANARTSTQKQY